MKMFSGDNFFTRLMNRAGILIAANLLFVLCCLPVFTAVAGLAALYYTLLRALREKWELNPFETFWTGLKENFRQGTLAGLALLLLAAALTLEVFWCGQLGGAALLFRYGLYALAVLSAAAAAYLFPVMAAFRCTLLQLMRNSMAFALRQPAVTLAALLLNVVPMACTFLLDAYLPLFAFLWCTVGFGGGALLCAKLFLPQFRPYLPAVEDLEGEAPVQKSERQTLREMRRLGL